MKAKIHVEGGGNRREANARCREGFREFFHRAGLDPRSLRVIPGGARTETYKSFRDDVETGHGDFVVLLVDSEGPLHDPPVPQGILQLGETLVRGAGQAGLSEGHGGGTLCTATDRDATAARYRAYIGSALHQRQHRPARAWRKAGRIRTDLTA